MDATLQNLLEADILQLAGLGDASPEARERALASAKNYILSAVVRRIRARMSPELQKEFEQLFGTEDDTITEKDMTFLEKHAPNLDTLILEETLAFKQGVMDTAQEINKKSADESQKINGILNGLKE